MRTYGWIPDLPDQRDLKYHVRRPDKVEVLPKEVDLRPHMPPVYDQGSLGSCTGQAIAAAIAYIRYKEEDLPDWSPSRLFIYYGERELEGTVASDSGAMIRDGIKVVANQGAPAEKYWPYEIKKFARKPSKTAYKVAQRHKALQYFRVNWDNLEEVKTCLAAGYPMIL